MDTVTVDRPRTRRLVPELVLVRGVACLGVVMIHALGEAMGSIRPGTPHYMTFDAARMLLMFSTPTFVFLSAAVVGQAYDAPPRRFLSRRFRYVIVPFLCMGLVYAVFYPMMYLGSYADGRELGAAIVREELANLTGGNHLWFIIPISQFYLLYALCGTWLTRIRASVLLPVTFALNVAYLGALDFGWFGLGVGAESERITLGLWFPAWSFYFVYGHWFGRNLDRVLDATRQHLLAITCAAAAGGFLVLDFHFTSVITAITSRRFDVLIYTVAMVPLLMVVVARVSPGRRLLSVASRYSFGIYMLHPMFILIGRRALRMAPALPRPVYAIAIWMIATGSALALTMLLSRSSFGEYLVGRPGRSLGSELASTGMTSTPVLPDGSVSAGTGHIADRFRA